jgi:hypothetical protein
MFDLFVAPLRCPHCAAETPEAQIQTHIRGESADGSELGIGAEIEPYFLTTDQIVRSGYALVNPPAPGDPIRLLDVWICRYCQTEQWALVVIAGGRVARIEAVTLDRETLESANFISDLDADLLADSLRAPDDDSRLSAVDVLRQRLPA